MDSCASGDGVHLWPPPALSNTLWLPLLCFTSVMFQLGGTMLGGRAELAHLSAQLAACGQHNLTW